MRKYVFLLIISALMVCLCASLYTMHKTENRYQALLDSISNVGAEDETISVIQSTCEMFDTIKWTKEDLRKLEGYDTIDEHIIEKQPWILIKGAERNLDTLVNHYLITFTTDKQMNFLFNLINSIK